MRRGPLLGLALFLALIGFAFGNPASEDTPAPSDQSSSGAEQQTPQANPTESNPEQPSPTPSSDPTASQEAEQPGDSSNLGTLEKLLALLQIEAELEGGYQRELFRHWIDADRNGCDTRREVLIVESITQASVGERCRVQGVWLSAFDGIEVTDPAQLDVDHMVPLKEAWDSGAKNWSEERRTRFANDLGFAGSLIAVTRSSNRSKSDKDPADWLPPLSSYRCQYIFDWMAVKYRWQLSIDPREATAISAIIPTCSLSRELPALAD
jgi:hypothetical protein